MCYETGMRKFNGISVAHSEVKENSKNVRFHLVTWHQFSATDTNIRVTDNSVTVIRVANTSATDIRVTNISATVNSAIEISTTANECHWQ